jgi:hypothetical protein
LGYSPSILDSLDFIDALLGFAIFFRLIRTQLKQFGSTALGFTSNELLSSIGQDLITDPGSVIMTDPF